MLRVGAGTETSPLLAELASPLSESAIDADFALTGIDFRRDPQGAGIVKIDLGDSAVNVDINKVGRKIRLEFYQTELPEPLDRRLDVVDFATPVQAIDSSQHGSTTVVIVEAGGQYDYLAYQADSQYIVSVKPLSDVDIEAQNKKFNFTGDRLSLNF